MFHGIHSEKFKCLTTDGGTRIRMSCMACRVGGGQPVVNRIGGTTCENIGDSHSQGFRESPAHEWAVEMQQQYKCTNPVELVKLSSNTLCDTRARSLHARTGPVKLVRPF